MKEEEKINIYRVKGNRRRKRVKEEKEEELNRERDEKKFVADELKCKRTSASFFFTIAYSSSYGIKIVVWNGVDVCQIRIERDS